MPQTNPPLPMETKASEQKCALELTKVLHEKDKLTNQLPENSNNTMLHTAASSGNLLKVKVYVQLLHYDPLAINRQGDTALHVASEAGHLHVVRYFVEECQVSPLVVSRNGSIPLHIAALCGHQHLVEYFIRHGIDPLYCNEKKETPLHLACLSNEVCMVEYLLTEAQKSREMVSIFSDSATVDGDSILHYAALSQCMTLVKFITTNLHHSHMLKDLLESKNKYGSLPIHLACREGCTEIVQYLLQCCPSSLYYKDNSGWSPVHYAALADTNKVLKYLISKVKADPMSLDVFHSTPLHFAAAKGCLESVQYLIEHSRCDPNICNIEGASSIFYACSEGNLSIVKYLIEKCHCDLSYKLLIDGEMIIIIAAQNGQFDVLRYLLETDLCDSESSAKILLCSLISGSAEFKKVGHRDMAMFVKFFALELKFDIDFNNLDSDSPLLAACRADCVEGVNYFLEECECDPLMTDDSGQSLLHFAAGFGAVKVVEYLVTKHHFDPMITNNQGETPMHCAAFYGENVNSSRERYFNALLQSDIVRKLSKDDQEALRAVLNSYLDDDIRKNKADFPVIRYLCTEMSCNIDPISDRRQTPLHSTCLKGKLNVVKFLIEEMDCDKMLRDENGVNALGFAVYSGNLELIRYLAIEQKFDPMVAVTGDSTSLLELATESGKVEVLELLIDELNCDLSSHSNHFRQNLLHFACANGSLECVQYLIKKGYNVYSRDGEQATPLHWAAFRGHTSIVEYLGTVVASSLQCNSNENTNHDKLGQVPIEMGQLTALEQLRVGITDLVNKHSQTPLHVACKQGHLDVVKVLIKKMNCDKSLRDERGLNALGYSIKSGHLELIRYLAIEQKLDPMVAVTGDSTSLPDLATESGKVEVLELLIDELNCDLSSHSNHLGLNLLHFACAKGNLECVQYLIQKGYNVYSRDGEQATPLHWAAFRGHTSIVEYLGTVVASSLQCNSNENTNHDKLGQVPIEMGQLTALEQLRVGITDLVNKHSQTPLHVACKQGHLDVVKVLIKKMNCDKSLRDESGLNALGYSIKSGHLELIRYLAIEQKLDPMVAVTGDSTSLPDLATESGKVEVLELLIDELNCDLSSHSNHLGLNLLHFACAKGNLECVQYLIKKGYNVYSKDDEQATPLHWAAFRGHTMVVKYLASMDQCYIKRSNTDDDDNDIHVPVAIENGRFTEHLSNCYINTLNKCKQIPLHKACFNGHLDIAKFLMDNMNCDKTLRDDSGVNALGFAVCSGNLELIRYLIVTHDFDPNFAVTGSKLSLFELAVKYNGGTAALRFLVEELQCDLFSHSNRNLLHHACANGNIECVVYLLEKGYNINGRDTSQATPFHWAAYYGHLNIVEYLSSYAKTECDLEWRNESGMTPAYLAAFNGHISVLEYLIEKLHCSLICDNHGRTYLHAASRTGHADIVTYLVEKCGMDVNVQDDKGCSPLHIAASYGHLVIVEYLTKCKNGKLMAPNVDSFTPAHVSALNGRLKVLKYFLIDCHIDVNNENKKQQASFVHYAAVRGHLDAVEFLIEKGCNFLSKDENGFTPPHLAVANGELDMTRYFIESLNYDPSKDANCQGKSPLHSACRLGRVNIVQYLVKECNCDKYIKDKNGLTPIMHAVLGGNWDAVACLTNHDNYANVDDKITVMEMISRELGNTPLHLACESGQEEIVKRIIECKPISVHSTDKSGQTPLHYAANYDHLNAAKLLLHSSNSDPMCKDNNGYTPLHSAALHGSIHVLTYLLTEEKCDPDIEDSDGDAALHFACTRPLVQSPEDEVKKLEVVGILMEYSDCLHVGNNCGDTPLHKAAASGYLRLVKQLIDKFPQGVKLRNYDGYTPLDVAICNHNQEVVEFLQERTTSTHSLLAN